MIRYYHRNQTIFQQYYSHNVIRGNLFNIFFLSRFFSMVEIEFAEANKRIHTSRILTDRTNLISKPNHLHNRFLSSITGNDRVLPSIRFIRFILLFHLESLHALTIILNAISLSLFLAVFRYGDIVASRRQMLQDWSGLDQYNSCRQPTTKTNTAEMRNNNSEYAHVIVCLPRTA